MQQYITTLRQLIIDILGDADNSNYKVSKEILKVNRIPYSQQ